MNRYQISVEVKIEESDQAVDRNPVEQADGSSDSGGLPQPHGLSQI